MPNNGPLYRADAYLLDEAGYMLESKFVDFRAPAFRIPITTLVKAGEKQFAPEELGTIRISKPNRSRNCGETQIEDPNEARFTRETSYSERFDDPNDLADAHVRDDEANCAAEITGSRIRRKTKSSRKTRSKSHITTLTYGKYGWIFCAAAAPTNQVEERTFWQTLKPEYNHAYSILRPTVFALALSAMVARQLDPRGSKAKLESKIGDVAVTTFHKRQTVFHGPVIYKDDPYELITGASNKLEEILLPMFTKGIDYQDQREYRFVIFTDDEPHETYVDIRVSSYMRNIMQKREDALHDRLARTMVAPVETADCEHDDTEDKNNDGVEEEPAIAFMRPGDSDLLPDPLDLLEDPTFPVRPHLRGSEQPLDVQQMTDSVLLALRIAAERVPDKHLVNVASAGFHAEPLLRSLCEVFLDPVQNIAISDNKFIFIRMNISDFQFKAQFVIGPLGEAAIYIQGQNFERNRLICYKHRYNFPLSASLISDLSQVGVRERQ